MNRHGQVKLEIGVYVIQSGRVVEEGTFTGLAAQDGLFSCMIAGQML